jgi:hypothetical protein
MLKDMGLQSTLDKLTDKRAQFDKFIPEKFSDVLGEEGTKELRKKRKVAEEAKQREKKKGKVVMKDGKFTTTYEWGLECTSVRAITVDAGLVDGRGRSCLVV